MAGESACACEKNCCHSSRQPLYHYHLHMPCSTQSAVTKLGNYSCSSCSSWSCCSSCYSCSSRTHEFLRNLSRHVILCAEVSIPEFMNKARGLLEQFRLHRCVYLKGEKSSFLQPSCWDIHKKYPMLEVEGPRNLTPASSCSSFEGSGVSWQMSCVWWIKVDSGGSLHHLTIHPAKEWSSWRGAENEGWLKKGGQDSHGLGFAHFPYHRLEVIMSLKFEPVIFFSYKSVKVHYDHFMIIILQREAGGNIEEISLEAARALCKAGEARNIIFHKCQWQQSLKNTWVQQLN